MVLTNPKYDLAKQKLTYQVQYLNPTKAPTSAKTLEEASIFIDGGINASVYKSGRMLATKTN